MAVIYPLAKLACKALAFYRSFKSLKAGHRRSIKKDVTFWVVLTCLAWAEKFTDTFIGWFPFYTEFKLLIVIWLILAPTSAASTLYGAHIDPFFRKKEKHVDFVLLNLYRFTSWPIALLQESAFGVKATTLGFSKFFVFIKLRFPSMVAIANSIRLQTMDHAVLVSSVESASLPSGTESHSTLGRIGASGKKYAQVNLDPTEAIPTRSFSTATNFPGVFTFNSSSLETVPDTYDDDYISENEKLVTQRKNAGEPIPQISSLPQPNEQSSKRRREPSDSQRSAYPQKKVPERPEVMRRTMSTKRKVHVRTNPTIVRSENLKEQPNNTKTVDLDKLDSSTAKPKLTNSETELTRPVVKTRARTSRSTSSRDSGDGKVDRRRGTRIVKVKEVRKIEKRDMKDDK